MKKIKAILLIIILVALDQASKYLVISNLKDKEPMTIIKNVFKLEYLENTGAAFGILKNQIIFFVIITFLILSVITFIYLKLPEDKKYTPMRAVLIFIVAGALGNFIDRVSYNYVVDFLYFELINFPVFNIADCYVTVSAFILVLLFLFYYKEEDFNIISDRIKRKEKIK